MNPDTEELLANKELFNATIYTPLEEALLELKRRQSSTNSINTEIPEILLKGDSFVMFRHIATPNYEIRRFAHIAEAMGKEPLFLEYTNDKFTSINEWKYYLAQLCFFKGKDKTGGNRIEFKNIIDFNVSNGKVLRDLATLWGQSLVDFHHEHLKAELPHVEDRHIHDMSEWLKKHGGEPKQYYKPFLSLFIRHGILFENFLTDSKELEFTRDIIIPAFFEILNQTGFKPLIVALAPTEIEGDHFWFYHPHESKEAVKQKLAQSKKIGFE